MFLIGFMTALNIDIKRELDYIADFLEMAADYKKEIAHDDMQFMMS